MISIDGFYAVIILLFRNFHVFFFFGKLLSFSQYVELRYHR